jgi:hypothetical protein
MADLIPGENFVNGQQVDDTRLNNHVAGARLTAESISSRDPVPAKAMQVDDLFLVRDASEAALRRAKLEDIRESNIPLAASTFTTTGTSTLGGDTTIAGTLSTTGSISTTQGNVNVAGGVFAVGAISGATAVISGNSSFGGNVTIAGTSTFSGPVNGLPQIKEILEYTIPQASQVTNTSPAYPSWFWTVAYQSFITTKPANEIWTIDAEFVYQPGLWKVGEDTVPSGPEGSTTQVDIVTTMAFFTRFRVGPSTEFKIDLISSGGIDSGGWYIRPTTNISGGFLNGKYSLVIPANVTWTDQYIAFDFSSGRMASAYAPYGGLPATIGISQIQGPYMGTGWGLVNAFGNNKLRITKFRVS